MTHDRADLGAFLRSRRDRLSPGQAGIDPFPGPRRVPGLRKEELAMLAGLSSDYYSRVEQGRQAHVSREVLDALARALRLDETERAHLHDLADPGGSVFARGRGLGIGAGAGSGSGAGKGVGAGSAGEVAGRPPSRELPQRPDPGLLRLMDALAHVPVLLLGRRGDVLARNALLPSVLGSPLEPGTSFIRWQFLDPGARERIVNWETFAQASVGALRRELARRPDDRVLRALIDEVRQDAQVSAWWDDHGVRDYASVTKVVRHPVAGDLSFGIETVTGTGEQDQRLVVYTVEADSAAARALPLLASWSRDESTIDPSPARPL